MVDEADKAPTHVTAVLKTLVEDGEMLLTDGRRLVSAQIDGALVGNTDRTIPIHPVRLLDGSGSFGPGFPNGTPGWEGFWFTRTAATVPVQRGFCPTACRTSA